MVKKLGYMINYFRKSKKLTMEELGDKLGKSPSAISRWVSGDRSPMVEDLIRLTEIFDTDIETLLYGYASEDKLGEYQLYHGNLSVDPNIDVEKVKAVTLSQMVFGRYAADDLMLVQVNGQSMNRKIPKGSLVAIAQIKLEDLKDGDIVCVNEPTGHKLKEFVRDTENKRYIFKCNSSSPFETDYVIEQHENIDIIGKIVVTITHYV